MDHHRVDVGGPLDLPRPGPHPRVHHGLQPAAGRLITEDAPAEGRPVEGPVRGEHVGAEGGHHLGQPVGSGRHCFPGEQVGVDHDRTVRGQPAADLALPGADPAGQAHPQHGVSVPDARSGSSARDQRAAKRAPVLLR